MSVLVVGAGWSGAVVARELHDQGIAVTVVEAEHAPGGHARCDELRGVVYEPNGAHIFHTSDARVAAYVQRFGMTRPYEHRVKTEVFVADDDEHGRLMSWPPQVAELRELPDWPAIEAELAALPSAPSGEDFETWVISLMGERLYRLFIEGYTRKQWGCAPSELSSRFAPRRVDLRRDGNTRLFRDRWEFFPPRGSGDVVAAIIQPVSVSYGTTVDLAQLRAEAFDAIVITAALDALAGEPGLLAWRGITMAPEFVDTDDLDGTHTAAYVINRPSLRVPYTRTVETKHATGQRVRGTVVSEEHPGADARHYPVPTVDGRYEAINLDLQRRIAAELAPVPVFFCGRLATYAYIDQDEAVARAFACADAVARTLAGSAQ